LKEEEEKAAEEARLLELEALKKAEEEALNEKIIIIDSDPVVIDRD
jgi:hypothetical protein